MSLIFNILILYYLTTGIKEDSVFSELSDVSPAKRARYFCKADIKLVLKRVFLNQKINSTAEGSKGEEDLEIVKRQVLTRQSSKKVSGPNAVQSDLWIEAFKWAIAL